MPQLDIYGIYHQIIWGTLFSYYIYCLVVEVLIPSLFSSLYARRELSKKRSDSDFFIIGLSLSSYAFYMVEFDEVSDYASFVLTFASYELFTFGSFLGAVILSKFGETFSLEYEIGLQFRVPPKLVFSYYK